MPGLNWGAQEMPGCVTYRDEFLPRGAVPEEVRMFRASVIAHEMSHMWFGDLVTMTWWEDTWLQESFADYMGYRVAADGAGFAGALLGHEAARKPGAYDADERRSTHPVAPDAEDVPDVDSAATIFDAISYAKGNSVIRQLVTWLGDETFLRGVNAYLTRHRFGNATLADFVAALDEAATDRDVRAWVELWLRRTGFDTLRVERDGDVPVLHRDGVRPHRVRVTAYDDAWVDGRQRAGRRRRRAGAAAGVRRADRRCPTPRARPSRGWSSTTGRGRPSSSGLCRIEDDLVRAVLWTMLFDQVQTGALDAGRLRRPGGAPPAGRAERHPGDRGPQPHPRPDPAAAGPGGRGRGRRWRPLAGGVRHRPDARDDTRAGAGLRDRVRRRPSHDAATLRAWLDAGGVAQLPLSPALRWRVVQRLAEIGAVDAAFVEAERLAYPRCRG